MKSSLTAPQKIVIDRSTAKGDRRRAHEAELRVKSGLSSPRKPEPDQARQLNRTFALAGHNPHGFGQPVDLVENELRVKFRSPADGAIASLGHTDQPPQTFEKRIRRNPGDLSAHIERVRYYLTQTNRSGCFSALVDLFIVLGPRGLGLRTRMMKQSAELLSGDLHNFLDNHLNSGISARICLPCDTSSILTEAISGTTELMGAGTSESVTR